MTLDPKIGVGLLVVIVGVVLVGTEAPKFTQNGRKARGKRAGSKPPPKSILHAIERHMEQAHASQPERAVVLEKHNADTYFVIEADTNWVIERFRTWAAADAAIDKAVRAYNEDA